MKARSFDFHGMLGLDLKTSDPRALAFFESEYDFAGRTLADEVPRVYLAWQASRFPSRSDPGMRLHVHKALAVWRYRVELAERQVSIQAVGNRLAIPMVHHMLVHPGLRFLASHRGNLLLHGAAVAWGGSSLILTGPGGVGKTTVSTLLMAAGGPAWSLHADDYVLMGDGPRTYGYLTRSHLYRSLLRWLPGLANRLTLAERLHLEVFGRVREWSGDRLKWPLRMSAARLWPGRTLVDPARLAGIVILRKGQESLPRLTRLPEEEVPVPDLVDMNFGEARHFVRLVEADPSNRPPSGWLESWRRREAEALEARRHDTPFYRLDLPKGRSDPTVGGALVELLESVLVGQVGGARSAPGG